MGLNIWAFNLKIHKRPIGISVLELYFHLTYISVERDRESERETRETREER